MAVRTVAVGDPRAFEAAIADHSARGFLLVSRTDTAALMRKPKQFNALLAVLGGLLCLVGLIVYAIYYAAQQDEVVEIRLVDRQAALEGAPFTLSPDGNWWWDGHRWQDTGQSLPPGVQRSPDGSQWWDGVNWRPVPGDG
jgi:hypothetical protein